MREKNYEPSVQELEIARSSVLYELRMLISSTNTYFDRSRSRDDPHIGSAFTDSILMHVRNLFVFLTYKPSSKDDIVTGHFVKDVNGNPWSSSKLTFIESCKDDINKYRSHLTYSRKMGKAKPEWNRKRMHDEIIDAFREFFELLPNSEWLYWKEIIKDSIYLSMFL